MKKRSAKPEKGQKQVKIDHKTIIFVDENIPDEQAIANWHEKRQHYNSGGGRKGTFKKKNDGLLLDKDD